MKSFSIILYFFTFLFLQSCGKNLSTKAETPIVEVTTFSYPIGNESTLEITYGVALAPLTPDKSPNIYRCEISPRPLPIGLNFDSRTCALNGTPIRPPNSTNHLESQFEIKTFASATATTSNGSWTLPYRILQSAPVLNYGSNGILGNKAVAVPTVVSNLASSSSGPITTCLADKALPPGLLLNTNTCEISGTVNTVVPSATYKITATGAGGNAEAVISFAFVFDLPTLTFGTIPSKLIINTAASIIPINKTGTALCSIAPPLPAGLSLNTSTCSISGTPTTESSDTYSITAYPGDINSAPTTSVNFSLTVAYNAPQLGYPVPNNPRIGSGYFFNTNVRTGVHHCSVSPPLPAGLTLAETTCGISGTPTGPSALQLYTVTAFPGPGVSTPSTNASFSLEILYQTPTLSYPSPPAALAGSVYFLAPTLRSGVDHCSVSPPLPAGLSLNTASCIISGTPTTNKNPQVYTVTAYPGPGNSTPSSNANVNLAVNYSAPSLSYPAINSAATGLAYSLAPNSKSGVDHCSISPTLPGGLNFDSNTCVISGIPQDKSIAKNYSITAYPGPGNSTPTFIAQLSLGVEESIVNVSFTTNDGPLLSYFTNTPVELTFSMGIRDNLTQNSFEVSNAEITQVSCFPEGGPYTSCSAQVSALASGPLSVKLKAAAAFSEFSIPVPETELVSLGSDGAGLKVGGIPVTNKLIYSPSSNGYTAHDYSNSISQDCTKIVFQSTSTNLYRNDPKGANYDIFYKDLTTGIIRRVSENPDRQAEIACQGPCSSDQSRISHNGRFVVFATSRTDLGALASPVNSNYFNTNIAIVVRDMTGNSFRLASITTEGLSTGFLAGTRNQNASISDDGRWVVFVNVAPNSTSKIYIKDMQDDGVGPDGSGGPLVQIPAAVSVAREPKIDKNANFVIFAGGTNTTGGDAYLWRREDNKTVLVSSAGGFYPFDINSDGTSINFATSYNGLIVIRHILSAALSLNTPLGPTTDQFTLGLEDTPGVWTGTSFLGSGGIFDDSGRKMYYRGLSTNWLGHYQYDIDRNTHTALPQLPTDYQANIQNPNICGQGTRGVFYTKPSSAPVNTGYQIFIYDLVNYEIIPLSGPLPTGL